MGFKRSLPYGKRNGEENLVNLFSMNRYSVWFKNGEAKDYEKLRK